MYNDGLMTVTASTIYSNDYTNRGGGIFNNSGLLNLTNCTISNNQFDTSPPGIIDYGPGGGIYNNSILDVAFTTIALNKNGEYHPPPSNFKRGAGIFTDVNGTTTLTHTLLAGNTISEFDFPQLDNLVSLGQTTISFSLDGGAR